MSEEILAQESEETVEEEIIESSEQEDSSDDLTEEEVEEGKTAKASVKEDEEEEEKDEEDEAPTEEKKVKKYRKALAKLDIVKYVVSEEGVKSYIVNKLLELLNSNLLHYLKRLDSNSICIFKSLDKVCT